MDLKIRVDTEQGIRLGSLRTGDVPVEVDATALTQRQRATLAGWLDKRDNVVYAYHLQALSADGLIAAVDAAIAQQDREAAAKAARLEEYVQDYLRLDLEAIRKHWYSEEEDKAKQDPRIVAILPKVREANARAWLKVQEANARAWLKAETEKWREYVQGEKVGYNPSYDRVPQGAADCQPEFGAYRAATRAYTDMLTRKQAELEAPARRRAEQIAAWVAGHGTQNQQERFAAGLLAEQEVLDAIETEAFGPTGEWPLYEKLVCPDVPHTEYCSGERGCKFTSEAAGSVSADEWGQLKAFKELLPTAAVEVREHEATCKECEETATRRGIRVTLQVGELEFIREYGVTA